MRSTPLPEKLRPSKLKNYIGQEKITGEDAIIPRLITAEKETGFFPSLIFWGPPGSGKTTLARIIANEIEREFFEFSAVNAKTKDIETVINNARGNGQNSPIIFLDEIHRFNKAQQDKLLPHVEQGNIILIGATTENPSFEVIRPLLSRTRVIVLGQHEEKHLKDLMTKGLTELKKSIDKEAEDFLLTASNGDARVLLNTLEIASQLSRAEKLTTKDIEDAMQRKMLGFDKQGEEHYNVISAFIKSMRASQPDAALYYLARMIEAGQDPLYIARRMVIFASEDIGNAQPTALVVANEVFRACETIGYPECAINLAHGVTYLASAKKDRSAYNGLRAAQEDVRRFGNLPVPLKIRNAPTKLMDELGYGKGYDLPANAAHKRSQAGKYDKDDYLPEKLRGKKYYK